MSILSSSWWGKKFALILIIFAVIAVIICVGNYLRERWEFWDDDPDRGATVENMNIADAFGDKFSKVVYLEQGWEPNKSLWFYNTTQGSDLLPYDFFLVLEQADSQELFRSPSNMNNYRYLVQKATYSNPDALPVGMVKDSYQGSSDKEKTYIGFTCAACHTSQINYKNVAIRIDGGPAAADMVAYLEDMVKALNATNKNTEKRQRFVNAVLDLDNYANEIEVLQDLDNFIIRIHLYNIINHSSTKYGYARLDAFGRIYNRVLGHLLNKTQLRELLAKIPEFSEKQLDHIMAGSQDIMTAHNREEITRRALGVLINDNDHSKSDAIKILSELLRNNIFNEPNAPVSYPFLWDIAQHDYVQWNGIGDNSGVGPLGRNAGEVIGVFATLDWHNVEKCTLSEILVGQCSMFGKTSQAELVRFDSSVNMHNLRKIETQLASLQSPRWEDKNLEDILPKLEQTLVKKGKVLFEQYCVSCHHDIKRDNDYRKIVASMNDYKKLGTDPQMVENSVGYTGKAGFLKDLYVSAGSGSLVLQEKMPVASLLTYATMGVVVTPDPDKNWLTSQLDWLFNIYGSFSNNSIKSSLKRGDYPLDTTKEPYASLQAYKGRPLNGIWATAPYLHNGSVPTLYDLLLPASCPDTEPNCEKRPETFMVGSRELDTEKVGFKSQGYKGFEFDTRKSSNSNHGHEYAAGNTLLPNGQVLPPLGKKARMALLEYLKSL